MSLEADEIDTKSPEIIRIGDFSFSLETKELQGTGGETLELRNQSAEILAVLAQNAGRVVSKEMLIAAVWPDTFVTDDSLVQCIADIRRALGDTDHKLVQNFPKRGYKLIAQPLEPMHSKGRPPSGPSGVGPPYGAGANRRARIRAMAVSAAVLVVVLAYLATTVLEPGRPESDGIPRIAVLPFDDFSTGADKGFLSDAIAEGIITELARSRNYEVIARNSSFRYRDQPADIRTIGRELGVEYVLEGSQQKDGDKLRVTAQLLNALDGSHVWAHTYDQEIGDLFSVQDSIVRTLADRVGYRIARPVPGSDPDKVNAMSLYLKGLATIRELYDEDHVGRALREFRKAIEADPDAHYGYMGAAFAYRGAGTFGWLGLAPDEAFRLGFENANRALELAPDNAEVHSALARLYASTGQVDKALARFEKAIQLNPSDSGILVGSTTVLLNIGRTDEAIARLQQAMGIDPFFPDWYHWQMGWALWEKEDCDGALASFLRMSQIPKGAHRMLAAVYGCLGDVENAQRAYRVFYEDAPATTVGQERERWKPVWTAPGSLERYLNDMRIAGMPD